MKTVEKETWIFWRWKINGNCPYLKSYVHEVNGDMVHLGDTENISASFKHWIDTNEIEIK